MPVGRALRGRQAAVHRHRVCSWRSPHIGDLCDSPSL